MDSPVLNSLWYFANIWFVKALVKTKNNSIRIYKTLHFEHAEITYSQITLHLKYHRLQRKKFNFHRHQQTPHLVLT